MKSEKGVTLTTLAIYIIVATILLGTLTFINKNVMSELSSLTVRSQLTNEILKFYSFFVKDVKDSNNLVEYSENTLRFDNGVVYSIKYRSNQKVEDNNQTYNIYEIYRGDTLISDEFSYISFDYNNEEKSVKVNLSIKKDDVVQSEEQVFKVGRGY